MTESREHLQTLTEIRGLMERSTKFLTLSGLSGVSAGVIALGGALAAYLRLRKGWFTYFDSGHYQTLTPMSQRELTNFLFVDALVVLALALLAVWYFTWRKARRQGLSVWTAASRRMIWALAVPLLAGGIFCLGLIYHQLLWLVCPAMLTFYGLTLLNASRYTYRDLEYLGLCEIGLGLLCLFLTGYSLLAWTIGFGVLHILYGTIMWMKYDRVNHDPVTTDRPNAA
jgi:hypothetical protein